MFAVPGNHVGNGARRRRLGQDPPGRDPENAGPSHQRAIVFRQSGQVRRWCKICIKAPSGSPQCGPHSI